MDVYSVIQLKTSLQHSIIKEKIYSIVPINIICLRLCIFCRIYHELPAHLIFCKESTHLNWILVYYNETKYKYNLVVTHV